jgi:hypothetical protein
MMSQQPPIGSIIDGPGEVFPLPRFWFVAKDEATLLQVQKNAFLFNWRKNDMEGCKSHIHSAMETTEK